LGNQDHEKDPGDSRADDGLRETDVDRTHHRVNQGGYEAEGAQGNDGGKEVLDGEGNQGGDDQENEKERLYFPVHGLLRLPGVFPEPGLQPAAERRVGKGVGARGVREEDEDEDEDEDDDWDDEDEEEDDDDEGS